MGCGWSGNRKNAKGKLPLLKRLLEVSDHVYTPRQTGVPTERGHVGKGHWHASTDWVAYRRFGNEASSAPIITWTLTHRSLGVHTRPVTASLFYQNCLWQEMERVKRRAYHGRWKTWTCSTEQNPSALWSWDFFQCKKGEERSCEKLSQELNKKASWTER